jgi:hypothetical protein
VGRIGLAIGSILLRLTIFPFNQFRTPGLHPAARADQRT